MEDTLTVADMTCDRLFHSAWTSRVSVMERFHSRCMNATVDLITSSLDPNRTAPS